MLIADGGGYYRAPVALPPPPPPPPPQRPVYGPYVTHSPAAPPAQCAIDEMRRRMEELRQQAEAARRAAELARQQAEQARLAAEAAEQRAKQTQDTAQQQEATRLRQTATSDDLRARKAEAQAALKEAEQKAQDCRVNDAEEGRGSDRPSQATLAAQDDVKQKQFSVSLLEPPPAGKTSPLEGASAGTGASFKDVKDAADPVFNAYANGKEPTQKEIDRMNKAVDQYLLDAGHEIRVAGAEADARGEDPVAAMKKQRDEIAGRLPKSGPLGNKSMREQFDEMLDKKLGSVKSESPAMRQAMVEGYDSHLKSEKARGEAVDFAKQADQRADQAEAYAQGFGDQDNAAATSARDNAKYLRQVADDAQQRVQRLDQERELDGVDFEIRLQELDVKEKSDKYQQLYDRISPYMTYMPAGADEMKQLQALETDLTRAQDRLDVLKSDREMGASSLELGDATSAYDSADADWKSASACEPNLREVKNPRSKQTYTVTPEGYRPEFWVDPGKAEDRKKVHQGDNGRYYMEVTVRGDTRKVELPPETARRWETYDRKMAAEARAKKADETYKLNVEDLVGDPENKVPGRLDPALWEGRSKEITDQLAQSGEDVKAAQLALFRASEHGATEKQLDALRSDLGLALNGQKYAQAQVDALVAVQDWRDKESEYRLAQQPGSGQTTTLTQQDIDKLRGDARKKLDELENMPGMLPDEMQKLRGLRTQDDKDLAKAETAIDESWKKFQKTGDDKDYRVALNEKERIELLIRDHDTQIRQAELEGRITADQHLFGQRKDADDPETTLVAPPSDYAQLLKSGGSDDGIKVTDGGKTWTFKDGKQVTERDGKYYVSYEYIVDSESGAYATRSPEKELDPVASRLWRTHADLAKAGDERQAFEADQARFLEKFPPSDEPALGADGQAPKLTFTEDLDKRLDQVDKNIDQLNDQLKGLPPAGAVVSMDAKRADLERQLQLATAERTAVKAMQDWKAADFTNKDARGRALAYRQDRSMVETTGDDRMHELQANALKARSDWLELRDKQIVDGKRTAMDQKSGLHEQWKSEHPGFTAAQERDSQSWKDLQKATAEHGEAQRLQNSGTAAVGARTEQEAFVKSRLRPDQYGDNRELYKLFNEKPEVMAQSIINEHYLKYGDPITMQGRTHLGNEVGFALGWTPSREINSPAAAEYARLHEGLFPDGLTSQQRDMHKAVVDQIVDVGGENARVTVLPVVYATDDRNGGIIKTAVFKVEGQGGAVKYVDEQGRRYNDLDDYRANNTLPVEGVNLVMPEDGNFTLDDKGNVKLFTGDARTETDWQEFRREWHVDTVVGGLAVAAGVVMTIGSGGALVMAGAALVVAGASMYGVVTSAQSLQSQAAHGVSINFITNRQARMDWLNLGASALALPTIGAAGRAAVLAARAKTASNLADKAVAGGKTLEAAAHRNAQAGFQAGAEKWSAMAKPWAKPTMAVGLGAFEEGGRYMADNWKHMSTAEKWEQGGMMLLNLADMGSGFMIPRIKANAAGTQVGTQQVGPPVVTPQVHPGGGNPLAGGPGTPAGLTPPASSGTQARPGAGPGGRTAGGNPAGTPAGVRPPGADHGTSAPATNSDATAAVQVPDLIATTRGSSPPAGRTPAAESGADGSITRNEGSKSASGESRGEAPAGTARGDRRRVRQIGAGQAPQAAARAQQAPAGRTTEHAQTRGNPPADGNPQGSDDPPDFSFGPEAAGLKPQELADIQAGYRFASADPLVGKLAHDIEEMFPGLVVGVNVPARRYEVLADQSVASRGPATDSDILLRDGTVIQVKEGNAGKLIGQVHRTQEFLGDGATVIGYAPEYRGRNMLAEGRRQGLKVTNDFQELIDMIRPQPGADGTVRGPQGPDLPPAGPARGDAAPLRPAAAPETGHASRVAPPETRSNGADPAATVADAGGVSPAKLLRLGWRRTLGAVDNAFQARFGDLIGDGMPAASGRYNLFYGKRRFFEAANGERVTAPNAREFARNYEAVTRRTPGDESNPFAQVYHRIGLMQSPRRTVETMAHELAHAYQNDGYEAIDHPYLSEVLAEGGADIVVRQLLGEPRRNVAYDPESRLLQDAIDALGDGGPQTFLRAFFRGDAEAVGALHAQLRTEYAKLPAGERAAREAAAELHGPGLPGERAQVQADPPAPGIAVSTHGVKYASRAGAVPSDPGEVFAVSTRDPGAVKQQGRDAVPTRETYASFDEAARAAAARTADDGTGGAWVYRLSPDPQHGALNTRDAVNAAEVAGALRVDSDGAVVVGQKDLFSGTAAETKFDVSQLLEGAINGRAGREREAALVEDALWIQEATPSGDRRVSSIIVRSPRDEARASAWFRMSEPERAAAAARATNVLTDLVGPNWSSTASLRRDGSAPATVFRFSDIHLHVGGRSNGYGIDNAPGPRILQVFQRAGERRGAQVQEVMTFPVPDATTHTPYYMMQAPDGSVLKLELVRQGDSMVLRQAVDWPAGPAHIPARGFSTRDVANINDGAIEWLTRRTADGRVEQYVETYVVPNRQLTWRGLERSEATMQEVLDLPDHVRQQVNIGLIGGQMAHPLGVRNILHELMVANRLDPSGTRLHIPGGGELTGIKEGVSLNHAYQIDVEGLSRADNGLDLQLQLYGKGGGLVVVHFDADSPSYVSGLQGMDGSLLVSKTSGTQNLDALYATFRRNPDATVVHAHWGGLSRSAGPSEAHAAKIRELLEETPNVYIDASWDAAGRRIFQDPQLAKVYSDLINDFPDRFISGSDEVAQQDNFNGAVRLQQESGFAGLLREPEQLYTGNFQRVVTEARDNMAAFRTNNAGLLVPEILASNEPIPAILGRLRRYDEVTPQADAPAAREQVNLSDARPASPDQPPADPGPTIEHAARAKPPTGRARYAAGVALTGLSAAGVHLLATKTGLPLGDPAITNPVAFVVRGLMIGAKTRLTNRIAAKVDQLGMDPAANKPILDRLERQLVKHGALIGIRKDDRALIQQAITEMRADPTSAAAALKQLEGARGKVLSPRTVAGFTDAAVRHGTFAYNLGNASATLSQEGWFQPGDAGYWSTVGFTGANFMLSNNNFNAAVAGMHRAGTAVSAKIVQVGQAAGMSTFSLSSVAWAINDFEPSVAGVTKSALDLTFGAASALQARNDFRALQGKPPADYGKLPHPLSILAGSLVAREGFDINNYF